MNTDNFFETIKSYRLMANKDLGQNFLIDPNIAQNIVNLLDIKNDENVIEIGAGFGSLSYFLSKTTAKVDLIDIDERCLTFLNEQFQNNENIMIRRENVLKTDFSKYDKIIGNLPYYITSRILENIALKAVNSKKVILMCQKEVYPKLKKDLSHPSPLSNLLNYLFTIKSEFVVGRSAFLPQPHVDSIVISLSPKETIKNKRNKILYYVMSKLFLYRRKTIENNLTTLLKDREIAQNILKKANISTNLRPEELKIENFLNLTDILINESLIEGE